ncbi:MAG: transposase family protein [Pseudomonadota bacterium]
MSKPSRRPTREAIKQQRKEKKQAEKQLRERQMDQDLTPSMHTTTPNRRCSYETVAEEKQARQEAVSEQARVFRSRLPILLNRLSRIPDPRDPQKLKHKLTLLMIYGILTFVFQMASRRQANRKMTRPMFMENLKLVFPELENLPHHDTLMRLLSEIDVGQIERTHIELVKQLIRKKKFQRYLINGCYPIAMDGSQKLVRDWLWAEECLEREVKDGDKTKTQYYVYVLEAALAFSDGMTIPLMSEFLSYTQGDTEAIKQDCEIKAFYRLAKRLKKEFPCLRIMVMLDGLYAKGPVMEVCRKNKWQFIIVLKDNCLKSVWEEFEGLKKLQIQNRYQMNWGHRKQSFQWVVDIEYCYGSNDRQRQTVHVVVCEENWQEVAKGSSEIIEKTARHAWISNTPLDKSNIHELCNLGARHRWGIESEFLVEKRHGYQYEHNFSYNWNAMKGYHYLMRLGHMLNILAHYSERLIVMVKEMGIRGFIQFVCETISGPWLDAALIKQSLAAPFQLRLA